MFPASRAGFVAMWYVLAMGKEQIADNSCPVGVSSDECTDLGKVSFLQTGLEVGGHALSETKTQRQRRARQIHAIREGNGFEKHSKMGSTGMMCDNFGLSTCDGDDHMPYAYAYHFHPTYSDDTSTAAKKLQDAFEDYFGIAECATTSESTLYSVTEGMCSMSRARRNAQCDKATYSTFPKCQYGIYVPAEKMFDNESYAMSPWQWMTLNKDAYGDVIDVFVHSQLTCPKLAHGQWSVFINGTDDTDAATGITGENGADGCYGKTCEGCPDTAPTLKNGCCALSDLDGYPSEVTAPMATTYKNILRFQTEGAWWDATDQEMKNYSTVYGVWPSTMWPSGCVPEANCDGIEGLATTTTEDANLLGVQLVKLEGKLERVADQQAELFQQVQGIGTKLDDTVAKTAAHDAKFAEYDKQNTKALHCGWWRHLLGGC